MRNIKIIIEYDGTKFCGWQFQKHCRSVQGELQKAVKQITGEECTVEGAGRTDAGVHARGQVGNFKIEKVVPVTDLQKGLNAVLPHDVRIKTIEEVGLDFHARFSAKKRRYRYSVVQEPIAIDRQYLWFCPYPLNFDLMQEGCTLILGERSFKSFCLSESEVSHYRCNVEQATWVEDEGVKVFEITANRFLHNMVRCLVGTFVNLGRGKISLDELKAIIDKEDRTVAGFTAPAMGLCLEEVVY